MKDRTRRTESGKMLLDVAKYLLTATTIGSVLSTSPNLKIGVAGLFVACTVWALGYLLIPIEKEEGLK